MRSRSASSYLALAAGIVVCAALLLSLTPAADAKPPGIPAGAKLVYKFNLIGYPAGQTYDGGCGQGRRIFVNRDASNIRVKVTDGNSWEILDCDATDTREAVLQAEYQATYNIYVKILGKPGGQLRICVDTYTADGDHLCLLDEINLTRGRGQSSFSVRPKAIFDARAQDLLWYTETNSDYRIAQFRIYEVPAS